MRVLFLDIDGVLNSKEWFMRTKGDPYMVVSGGEPRDRIDPEAVVRLNRLVRETAAHIVVSSSWRTHARFTDRSVLFQTLASLGIEGPFFDVTPRVSASSRGTEIWRWLRSHQSLVESYAIVDDDPNMDPVPERHVWIDDSVGLQDADVEALRKLLLS